MNSIHETMLLVVPGADTDSTIMTNLIVILVSMILLLISMSITLDLESDDGGNNPILGSFAVGLAVVSMSLLLAGLFINFDTIESPI